MPSCCGGAQGERGWPRTRRRRQGRTGPTPACGVHASWADVPGMRAARLECRWGGGIYRITLPFLKHLDGIEGSQTGHRAHEPDAKWFSKGRLPSSSDPEECKLPPPPDLWFICTVWVISVNVWPLWKSNPKGKQVRGFFFCAAASGSMVVTFTCCSLLNASLISTLKKGPTLFGSVFFFKHLNTREKGKCVDW